MRRVDAAVREVLSEAVGELKDPRIGFVTITGVKTSADLQQAVVFVSVFGSERKREKTIEGLQAAHGILQAQDRPGAETEADPAADLRIRSNGRARRAHDPTHR